MRQATAKWNILNVLTGCNLTDTLLSHIIVNKLRIVNFILLSFYKVILVIVKPQPEPQQD